MPSPFPGMDPYLENPGLWPDVHHEFISLARRMLRGQVHEKYNVQIEERVYVSGEDDPGRKVLIPDVLLLERPDRAGHALRPAGQPGVGVAEPVEAVVLVDEEIHEYHIEIRDREGNQLVTVIEILSPANKVAGAQGREAFTAKRRQTMQSPTHWVGVDLLRRGISLPIRQQLRPHEYLALVSRAERRPRAKLWPIRLSERLPVLPIPLRPGDADAQLDLQQVLIDAYEGAGYASRVNYRAEPDPPLDGPWAEWADRLLRDKGVR